MQIPQRLSSIHLPANILITSSRRIGVMFSGD
jgi:hypothetical protein